MNITFKFSNNSGFFPKQNEIEYKCKYKSNFDVNEEIDLCKIKHCLCGFVWIRKLKFIVYIGQIDILDS